MFRRSGEVIGQAKRNAQARVQLTEAMEKIETTYQLPLKAKSLDELDGGHTNVDWCPDYLYVPKSSSSSMRDVTQMGAGLYYYHHDPEVAAWVIAAASEIDEGDI